MTVLLTGAAGFIGYHLAEALLARGERVVGIDVMNDYYDPALKQARLDRLAGRRGFAFHRLDICDREGLAALTAAEPGIERIVHLAAQAGVRYSLDNPFAYAHSNLEGQLAILELARGLPGLRHLVYASSSSVYGANTKVPFAVGDPVDNPVSLYAATKKSGELMAHCYSHLFGLPTTGLRFFTVYGPWGRPDMAYYSFTARILAGQPIPVFNHGDMRRDFTWIEDIIDGVLRTLDSPPATTPPYRLFNIGNNRSEPLLRFIAVLEQAIGRKAVIELKPMQPGDVKETFADIADIQAALGYAPATPIDAGLPRFVAWFRDYHRL
ncbi:MAG: NAD-dependent epimerase [Thalassobaculales bacterium]